VTPFLLSSQSVFDIVKRINLPAERWLADAGSRNLYEEDICISAVVPMTVQHAIATEIESARQRNSPELAALKILQDNARKFLAAFQQQDRIVSMDHRIAERWGDLLDMKLTGTDPYGAPNPIGSSEKVELATASIGRDGQGFVYVDRRQEAHDHVPGLVVECPHVYVSNLPAP